MISGTWFRIAPERSSTPLQTMSYWTSRGPPSAAFLQRLKPALGHGKRVVREVDCLVVLVALIHRKIDDPAEPEHIRLDQAKLLADPPALQAPSPAILDAGPGFRPRRKTCRRRLSTPRGRASAQGRRLEELRDAGGLSVLLDKAHIRQGPAPASPSGPAVHLVEEAARLFLIRRCRQSRARPPPAVIFLKTPSVTSSRWTMSVIGADDRVAQDQACRCRSEAIASA